MHKIGWKSPLGVLLALFLVVLMSTCGGETKDPDPDGGGQSDAGGGGDSGLVSDCSDYPSVCQTSSDCAPVGCKCTCQSCGDGFSYEDVVNIHCVEAWYDQHQCLPPVGCPGVCCPQRVIICEGGICKAVDGKI